MNKIVLTICSQHKDSSIKLLPANKRYISERIEKVSIKAKDLGLPLYFLSGKYGLISEDELIPFYNEKLTQENIDIISEIVVKQVREYKIEELVFFAEHRSGDWIPYYQVVENLSNTVNVDVKLI